MDYAIILCHSAYLIGCPVGKKTFAFVEEVEEAPHTENITFFIVCVRMDDLWGYKS